MNQTAFIIPLQDTNPSAQSLLGALQNTKFDVAFLNVSVVEELSRSPEILDHVAADLDALIYAGGEVSRRGGDEVSRKIPLIKFYGNTEGASIALVRSSRFQPEDWEYLSFHPASGTEFRQHTEGVYELFIVRQPNLEQHQQIFDTFPDLEEFRSRDLFRKHPTKANLWSQYGRADGTVVLTTGEKMKPAGAEQKILSRNPEATGQQPMPRSSIVTIPTVAAVAERSQELIGPHKAATSQGVRRERVERILAKYKGAVDRISRKYLKTPPENPVRNVLLIGSHGTLGPYLLKALQACHPTQVAHVVCLNPAPKGYTRQLERSDQLGLSKWFPQERVTFYQADLVKPQLGLDSQTYSYLLNIITQIIHCEWPENFNYPLSSFEPEIEGLVRLIKLASLADQLPPISFVSSVSAVFNLSSDHIPEEIIYDPTAPANMGYGESKYVAERILDHATQRLSLRVHIARIGLAAGPIRSAGEWNRDEWLPSLIRSSLYLGIVPSSLGNYPDKVDWIPIDIVAQIVVELTQVWHSVLMQGSQITSTNLPVVFNIVNPHPVKWKDLLPSILAELSSTSRQKGRGVIKTCDLETWLRECRKKGEELMDLARRENKNVGPFLEHNPAYKLLDFYEEAGARTAINWDPRRAGAINEVFRGLESVKQEWMVKWMKGWLGEARNVFIR